MSSESYSSSFERPGLVRLLLRSELWLRSDRDDVCRELWFEEDGVEDGVECEL